MATSKSAKIQAEMDKVKAKISEAQARLKELEQKHREAENEEIVDIVRAGRAGPPAPEAPGHFWSGWPEVHPCGRGGDGMKKARVLTAALCAVVLMCGFATPAYAGAAMTKRTAPGARNSGTGLVRRSRPPSRTP